jgi:RNA polymerase sigma factor (sigma-70 family)
MLTSGFDRIQQYLHQVADNLEPLTDRQLIDHFLDYKDEKSFARLIQRFGPMVLGVCKRVLGNRPEVEDVFQATFLTLTQQIHSLRNRDLLAGYLYRIAYRIAQKVRTKARITEPLSQDIQGNSDPIEAVSWNEIRGVLDEELNRLPDRLRIPLILCYFEGDTRDEAARKLGWSLRTLDRRLEEGRKRLHSALSRRGLTGLMLGVASFLPEGLKANVLNHLISKTQNLLGKSNLQPQMEELALSSSSILPLGGKFSIKIAVLLAVALGIIWLQIWLMNLSAKPQQIQKEKVSTIQKSEEVPQKEPFQFGSKAFRHSDDMIIDAAMSPDGRYLATASPKSIVLFELESGKPIRVYPAPSVPFVYSEGISLLNFSTDSKRLATLSRGPRTLTVWNLEKDKESHIDLGPTPSKPEANPPLRSLHVVFLEPEKLVFWEPKTRTLWDLRDTEHMKEQKNLGSYLALSPNNKEVLTVQFDPGAKELTLLLSESLTGKEIARIPHPYDHVAPMLRASYSLDGKWIITTDREKGYLWDRKTLAQVDSFEMPKGKRGREFFTSSCFHPDNQSLFLGTMDGIIYRYELKSKKFHVLSESHTQYVTKLFITPDGKRLLSASMDQTIRQFDLQKKEELPFPDGYVGRLVYQSSPNHKQVAIGDASGRIDLWDDSGKTILHTLQQKRAAICLLAYSSEGKYLASSDVEGNIRVWDCTTGKELKHRKTKADYSFASTLVFLPDSSKLIIPYDRMQIQLWNWKEDQLLWKNSLESFYSGILSPDGKWFLNRTLNLRTFYLQDPETAEVKKTFPIPQSDRGLDLKVRILSGEFSPDNQLLATGHADGTIRTWSMKTNNLIKQFPPTNSNINQVHFSKEGDWLLTISDALRLWEVRSGGLAATKPIPSLHPVDQDLARLEPRFGLIRLFEDVPLPKLTLEKAWELLAEEDPEIAFNAMRFFTQDLKAPTFFSDKISPAKAEDPEIIQKWIADLESERFTVRESATKKLREKGKSVIPALKKTLRGKLSPETQERITKLHDSLLETYLSEELRTHRAVQILSWQGSNDSIKTLEKWASGAEEAPLTEDAKVALKEVKRTFRK